MLESKSAVLGRRDRHLTCELDLGTRKLFTPPPLSLDVGSTRLSCSQQLLQGHSLEIYMIHVTEPSRGLFIEMTFKRWPEDTGPTHLSATYDKPLPIISLGLLKLSPSNLEWLPRSWSLPPSTNRAQFQITPGKAPEKLTKPTSKYLVLDLQPPEP